MNTTILVIYFVLLLIYRPYKSIAFMIIAIFNEACVLLTYFTSIILAYFDYKKNYNNLD